MFHLEFDEKWTYNIHEIFKEFDMRKEAETFVIWNDQTIDSIKSRVLLDHWNYIWYGESDEAIILYQKENARVILITHYGRIFYNSVPL